MECLAATLIGMFDSLVDDEAMEPALAAATLALRLAVAVADDPGWWSSLTTLWPAPVRERLGAGARDLRFTYGLLMEDQGQKGTGVGE